MAIKQAQYKITLANGEDIYHFETDDNMVKIVDGNKSVLGTFKEYGMEGKVVTSGAFTDLKVTGIYKVTNLTGLPSGYAIGKMSILSVKAVGRVGNPDLISYDLFSQTGDIYHNVVLGSTPTGWTSGGTTVKNALSALTNGLGDLTRLNTTAKGNLVNAVNEVSLKLNTTASTLTTLTSDFATFKGHNHDDKYVTKSGDIMTGNLGLKNNTGIVSKTTLGLDVSISKLDSSNEVVIGDTKLPIRIESSTDALLNGGKIWHSKNMGSGSGLDADKLGGFNSGDFARLNKQNSFKYDMYINDDKSLNMYSSKTGDSPIYWRDDDKFRGEVYFDTNKDFIVKSGGNVKLRANSEELVEIWGSMTLSATRSGYSSIRLKRWDSSKGSGLEIDKVTENIVLKDWDKDATGFTFEKSTSEISFPRQIKISGRKLYMQSSTPTGSRTTGDIWIA